MSDYNTREARITAAIAEAAETARRRETEKRLTRDDVIAEALAHYGLSPAFASQIKAQTPTAIRREVARLVFAQSTIAAAQAGAPRDAQTTDN